MPPTVAPLGGGAAQTRAPEAVREAVRTHQAAAVSDSTTQAHERSVEACWSLPSHGSQCRHDRKASPAIECRPPNIRPTSEPDECAAARLLHHGVRPISPAIDAAVLADAGERDAQLKQGLGVMDLPGRREQDREPADLVRQVTG